ncbi:hypothetical protein TH53_04395 [Pedobacter lusitanus]|uniref:HlyD family secretion protein n=1 Tax=Pedobacter lusitanus TaxID=1503925 RepID=A0A0D0GLZ8_9SPHI|nr:hypothetical protein [Pedobacter lusitanus]KIO78262.1 hypothetical protein TH53_04395 [Pedobacter lusitanus]
MKTQIEISDELRREQLLGPISGWSMLWGNYLVLIAFLLLAFFSYTVKYPNYVYGLALVTHATPGTETPAGKRDHSLILALDLSDRDSAKIKVGQRVSVIHDFSIKNLNNQKITGVVNLVTIINHKYYITAIPDLYESNGNFLSYGVKNNVKITIKSVTLFDRIFHH